MCIGCVDGKDYDGYLCDLFKTIYRANGYKEALEIFRDRKPDIVVLFDLDLNWDTLLAAEEIRRADTRIPIVVVGKGETKKLLRCIKIKIEDYLLWPLDKENLAKTLKNAAKKVERRKKAIYQRFLLERYKEAIDASNIVSKTDPFGIITYVNDEFCRISGYSREELIGKNHNIVRHPDVPREVFERFWKTIQDKKIWKGTVKNKTKDQNTVYLNTTVIPIIDSNDKIVEYVAIRYDVTQMIKMQEELLVKERELEGLNRTLEQRVLEQTRKLQELNKNLEERVKEEVEKNRQKDRLMFQQSRLASMGEMIGNIAHQWRQPLTELSIVFYALKKSYEAKTLTPEAMAGFHERIKRLINKMSQTIEDFRNFFSPNKEKEHFRLSKILGNILSIMEGSLKKDDIKIHLVIKDDIELFGYANEFSQALMNIIANARDALNTHLPREKSIQIVVTRRWVQLQGLQEAAQIRIRDNGGGIAPEIFDKIFEPYFTTKHSYHGTGIGLYMSKMIIEQNMGGMIEVRNVQQGAEFVIIVPVSH